MGPRTGELIVDLDLDPDPSQQVSVWALDLELQVYRILPSARPHFGIDENCAVLF
jgi:hypothetical protein